jgi:hypothetical protein
MQVIEQPSQSRRRLISAADAMHALLIRRADELQGCTEDSAGKAELGSIADALTAYELMRWPEGKATGGKG